MIGVMNTEVIIKEPSKARGGAGGSLETYTAFREKVWTRKKQKNAGENYQGDQLVATQVVEFHMYYMADLTEQMIIEEVVTGEVWEIHGINHGGFFQKTIVVASKKDFE